MVQKFQKLILMIKWSRFWLSFGLICLIVVLAGCSNRQFPRPTRQFYVNDFADALSDATKNNILEKGELLYDMSNEFEDIGGAQIVFVTFMLETPDQVGEYEATITDLFNEWHIGKNDMGLLIMLLFIESDDEFELSIFHEVIFAFGDQMLVYLTPSRLGQIANETIYFSDDLDMELAHFLHEVLKVLCLDAYEYEEFADFDTEGYAYYFENYIEDDPFEDVSMTTLIYLLSPYSSLEEKLFALLPLIISFIIGGGLVFNRGGGGLSSGARIFRRRR